MERARADLEACPAINFVIFNFFQEGANHDS